MYRTFGYVLKYTGLNFMKGIMRETIKLFWWFYNGAFIIEQPEQQFKIQSHFGIFDSIIGEGQWYDYEKSQTLECICESFGNICFLYSMK